jgi:hypothetical protein
VQVQVPVLLVVLVIICLYKYYKLYYSSTSDAEDDEMSLVMVKKILARRRVRVAILVFNLGAFAASLALSFCLLHRIHDLNEHPHLPLLLSLSSSRYLPSPSKTDNDESSNATTKSRVGSIPVLSPMWTCSCNTTTNDDVNATTTLVIRQHKLVFVHAFKTAGMTLRELLLRYAVNCHVGIGMVSECSGLVVPGMDQQEQGTNNRTMTLGDDNVWLNGYGSKKGQPCVMKAMNRNQQELALPKWRIETQVVAAELDLLVGHVPLGVGRVAWAGQGNTGHGVQYLTFFRRAIDKFVSGIMYQKKDKNYTFQDTLELIRKRVQGELKQHKYREGYSAYLLTPLQKEQFYGSNTNGNTSTIDDRTQKIIRNLEQQPILVGIVERMSESLQLLQFLIDHECEQTALFQSFGMKTDAGDNNKHNLSHPDIKKNNPSKFSTLTIVAELERDADFWPLLREYVKYDDLIYQRALQLHMLQYQEFLRQRGTARHCRVNH